MVAEGSNFERVPKVSNLHRLEHRNKPIGHFTLPLPCLVNKSQK